MNWFPYGLVFLFFWVLIGQYVYREAKREDRSSPTLRGVFWGVYGVVGAVTYLAHIRTREKRRLAWLAFSLVLFAVWGIGTFGLWGLSSGFYLWADLFAGIFILYWQFNLETVVVEDSSYHHQ